MARTRSVRTSRQPLAVLRSIRTEPARGDRPTRAGHHAPALGDEGEAEGAARQLRHTGRGEDADSFVAA